MLIANHQSWDRESVTYDQLGIIMRSLQQLCKCLQRGKCCSLVDQNSCTHMLSLSPFQIPNQSSTLPNFYNQDPTLSKYSPHLLGVLARKEMLPPANSKCVSHSHSIFLRFSPLSLHLFSSSPASNIFFFT